VYHFDLGLSPLAAADETELHHYSLTHLVLASQESGDIPGHSGTCFVQFARQNANNANETHEYAPSFANGTLVASQGSMEGSIEYSHDLS
jgi:hypothetical protein